MNNELHGDFLNLKADHRANMRQHAAFIVPGSSVIRVFDKGTNKVIIPNLSRIPVDEMLSIKTQVQFKAWFEKNLKSLSRTILNYSNNKNNNKIMPGYKWGHSTKILCLFLREIVSNSHYFTRNESDRLEHFLYCPIDGILMARLKELGIKLDFKLIKDIDTQEKFYGVQDLLGEAAMKAGIPRVWFDDNWSKRKDNKN